VMKIKFEDGLPVVKAKGLKKAEWFSDDGTIIIPESNQCQIKLYCY
jgi:hypothetical protein